MSKKQLGTGIILLSVGVGLWFLSERDIRDYVNLTYNRERQDKWEAEDTAYKKDRKERDEEYSIEQRSWKETVALAQHGTPRTMPATEAAHMTRHWDERQAETGEPRFTTIAPFPEVIHRMSNEEKLVLVERELGHLRAVQRAVKDNIDIWHKSGAPDGPRFVSPLHVQNMISGDQADHENLMILEEMERLEIFKLELIGGVQHKQTGLYLHRVSDEMYPT